MRTRNFDSRNCKSHLTTVQYFNASERLYTSEVWSGTWADGQYSSLTDDPSGGRKRKSFRSKYAEHHHVQARSYPVSFRNRFYPPWSPSGATYAGNNFLPNIPWTTNNVWSPSVSSVTNALVRANNFFAAGCQKQVVDFAAFTVELPEIRNFASAFQSLREFLTTRYADGGSYKGMLKDAKRGSNVTLAYQFGLAPLIHDIKNMHRALVSLSDHIKWLKDNAGKPVRVRYAEDLPMPQPSDVPATTSQLGIKYSTQQARFLAWALITYDIRGLSDYALKARTLANAFGAVNPLGSIWELTKYSFLVDWIVDVGAFFERLRIPIDIPFVIHDSGYYTKVTTEREFYWTSWPQYGNPTYKVGSEKVIGFSRREGLAVPSFSLDLQDPTIKQWFLGGCLAIQRKK